MALIDGCCCCLDVMMTAAFERRKKAINNIVSQRQTQASTNKNMYRLFCSDIIGRRIVFNAWLATSRWMPGYQSHRSTSDAYEEYRLGSFFDRIELFAGSLILL